MHVIMRDQFKGAFPLLDVLSHWHLCEAARASNTQQNRINSQDKAAATSWQGRANTASMHLQGRRQRQQDWDSHACNVV